MLHVRSHVRIQMHRIDELVGGEGSGEAGDAGADLIESLAEVLAAMTRDEHERPRVPVGAEQCRQLAIDGPAHLGIAFLRGGFDEQRVDHGVASDGDEAVRHVLTEQGRARRLGRREMQRHERRRQPPVRLFGKRRPHVAGAQAGFDMADRNPPVEAGQRRHEHGRGIALHQGHIHWRGAEPAVDGRHQPGRESSQGLVRLHHVELRVDGDAELVGDLLQHLPVLSGRHDRAREVGLLPQQRHDRSQLDGLGTRAHEDDDVAAHERPRTNSRHTSQMNSLLVVR